MTFGAGSFLFKICKHKNHGFSLIEYNILKILEEIIMKILKKTFGVCLIGLGIGILLVLFLPVVGWLFLIGIIVIFVGILWLLC